MSHIQAISYRDPGLVEGGALPQGKAVKNVLILGASGQIARWVVNALAHEPGVQQTLLLRDPKKLTGREPANAKVVIGNVLDKKLLRQAVSGQDIVYANLTGDDLDKQAQAVIAAMQAEGVQRLVFVLALGICDEVPGRFGEWNNATIGEDLKPFRRAADAIEASGLAYTILRPAWLTDEDEVDHELTTKGQPFKGTVVSRKSVADVILQVIAQPELHVGGNLGVNKPGTDADKPYFM
jgi:uncharacterized protein YbjT (DUF2867 family)